MGNVFSNQIYIGPVREFHDCITVQDEKNKTTIENCIFDLSKYAKSQQDEMVSCIQGSKGEIKNCIFINGIKAILVGNGDHPIYDHYQNRWYMHNCVILNAGRRCPEVKDGATLYMTHCWIHNWGRTFDTRAFGAWANRGGKIIAENCIFTQSGGRLSLGIKNTIKDIANHVGEAYNTQGIKALFKPSSYRQGITRGLTADTASGGFVLASKCYTNKDWIRIENHENPLDIYSAVSIINNIKMSLPKFEYNGYTDLYKLFKDVVIGNYTE